jgi:Ca-activated chloride channel family protein
MRFAAALLAAVAAAGSPVLAARPQQAQAPQLPRPVFKSSVARVSVAATVRDLRGRPVTNLTIKDFELFDDGQKKEILDFSRDKAPVGLALLADVSGSMDVAHKRAALVEIARQLTAALEPADRVGLFAFHRELIEVRPLAAPSSDLLKTLENVDAYGRTSVFDAVAETSQRLIESSGPRRAIIVLTDGADNASRLSPGQVSGLASSIDVPIYVFLIVSPLDRAGGSKSVIDPQLEALQGGALGNLARWTGGEIVAPVASEDIAEATQQLVRELRHQYLMAFEPGGQAGWHPLEVRARRPGLTVRARSGYMVPARAGDRQ